MKKFEFKKKEEKEVNKPESVAKLLAWFVLMLAFVLVINFSTRFDSENDPDSNYVKEENNDSLNKIKQAVEDRFSNDYSYKYAITMSDIDIVYTGSVVDSNDKGIKTSKDEETNYYIKDGKYYNSDNDKEIDLYKDINTKFFDKNIILNYIVDNKYINDDGKLIYNIEDEHIKFEITIVSDKLTQIKYVLDDSTYLLKFEDYSK